MDRLANDIKDFLEKKSTKTFLVAAREFVDLVEMDNVDARSVQRLKVTY